MASRYWENRTLGCGRACNPPAIGRSRLAMMTYPEGKAPVVPQVALFFGESHVDAVLSALKGRSDERFRALNLGHIKYPIEPSVFDHDLFRRTLAPSEDRDCLYISMVGGNDHNILGLLQPQRSFDFILPEEPELPMEPGSECQTYGYVLASLKQLMSSTFSLLRAARAAVPDSMVQLEPPPPISDNEYIRKNLDEHIFDARPELSVSSPLLRYKLWRAHSELMRETCAGLGIRYVNVPTNALSEGRFLRADLYANPTHANGLYGEMLLSQVAGMTMT